MPLNAPGANYVLFYLPDVPERLDAKLAVQDEPASARARRIFTRNLHGPKQQVTPPDPPLPERQNQLQRSSRDGPPPVRRKTLQRRCGILASALLLRPATALVEDGALIGRAHPQSVASAFFEAFVPLCLLRPPPHSLRFRLLPSRRYGARAVGAVTSPSGLTPCGP
jgi:hypothetical protein